MSIKAIQTHYGNYYFRSRLEARWAVFFDSMGWRYFYEHEGYQLQGGWYLPDFFFYDFGFYAEVKPGLLNLEEVNKCKDLSIEMSVNNFPVDILLLEGLPSCNTYRTIKFGEIENKVLLLSEKERFHPMFYTEDNLPQATFLHNTKSSVKKALSYRFEHGEGLKNG